MKVLIIGSGGREHALAETLLYEKVGKVRAIPGNPGIAEMGCTCYPEIKATDCDKIVSYAKDFYHPDLVVVGPEAPLAAGLADSLKDAGIRVFGPTKAAAQMESSKDFGKNIMMKAGVPTARYQLFADCAEASEYVDDFSYPVYFKANDLAAGKGAIFCPDRAHAHYCLKELKTVIDQNKCKDHSVLVEEVLTGWECSVFAIASGDQFVYFPAVQDFKPLLDGGLGPNTGGMGAITPVPGYTQDIANTVATTIIGPTLRQLVKEGNPYQGLLYCGLMITDKGGKPTPKVIEFNCRFGDPETQSLVQIADENLHELFIKAADGTLTTRAARFKKHAAVTVVLVSRGYGYSDPIETGYEITGIEDAEQAGAVVYQAGTIRGDDGILRTAGGRVLNVTGTGMTLDEAAEKAYAAIKLIHFDGMHYRRDIGRC